MLHFKLPAALRNRLHAPLGQLIRKGTATRALRRELAGAELVVTVGDAVTERLVRLGLLPTVQIVDGREQRRKRPLPAGAVAQELHIRNPAGGLSEEAFTQLAKALAAPRPVRLVVQGEEDLLALIVLARFPERTLVLYGQPDKGVVMVRIDPATRRQARLFLRAMRVPKGLLGQVPRNH